MTRHAKNVTAGNIYTTHERKKDAKQSGYGSEAIRLGKDSIKVNLHVLSASYCFLSLRSNTLLAFFFKSRLI